MEWDVFAIRYADRAARTRADSFLFDPAHDVAHPMDYFFWILRSGERVIMVDTGYDQPGPNGVVVPSCKTRARRCAHWA